MLCLARLRAVRTSERREVSGKPEAESFGINSTSTIHTVYAPSSKFPKNKGPSLGKIQVKIPHQRNPYAMKFEDRSHEETERQQRCARSKAWNLVKIINKLKEKGQSYILFALRGMGIASYIKKDLLEREFVVDSGAGMH